eukprot:TRINITY_DN17988_c0_g1_i1.p1 TRINITY_DN17988_c0_g1~~TRINITY_DN17988_c0_g1_i1.p1  ORF type:complete len:799 (-),score=259.69 TRINITY_DN17988_c0_g1_i1:50-2398(-)
MVRFAMKGGVWKNTEDEILKAAVMKYGKNQWARISSLLVRKSAKQCKARWNEWLDPSIKKTDWSREEEERLLHLAKIMPTQWRSIAPLVGRTASQCLEHYNKLLDAAQAKDGTIDPSYDPRRLRPGEIDPLPETKPARCDPVDMDEDEKEMLSEARARLANTRGKKAKRKAREKQLDEARRLANLQKRRELKAAGINMSFKPRIRGINYNKEIPFHRKAPAGFFAPEEDQPATQQQFQSQRLEQLEGPRRTELEEKRRKEDLQKLKQKERTDLPGAIMAMNKLEPGRMRKRAKLVLPEPQISDRDLEELSKLGEDIAGVVPAQPGQPTSALVGSYAATPVATPTLRGLPPTTPQRTPMQKDTLMMEAENLVKLTQSQTPLHGEDNPELHPSDFSGVTPHRDQIRTPNPLATPSSQLAITGGATPGATPSRAVVTAGGATPFRDQFSINEEAALPEESLADERHRRKATRAALAQQLAKLPAPKFQYKIAVPEGEEQHEEQHEEEMEELEEDASDGIAREEARRRREEAALLRKCSSVVRRGLPRPAKPRPEPQPAEGADREAQAELLIQRELTALMRFDAVHFPPPGGEAYTEADAAALDQFADVTEGAMERANESIRKEAGLPAQGQAPAAEDPEYAAVWEQCVADVCWLDSAKKYVRMSKAAPADRISALSAAHEALRRQCARTAARSAKLERRVQLYNGGYQSRALALLGQIGKLYDQRQQAKVELGCFAALRRTELKAMPARLKFVQEELRKQAGVEKELQQQYAALQERVEHLRLQL